MSLINDFDSKGAGFTSLEDNIDTSIPVGQFTFRIFAVVAQFDRDIIRMRTIAHTVILQELYKYKRLQTDTNGR